MTAELWWLAFALSAVSLLGWVVMAALAVWWMRWGDDDE